MSFGGGAAEVTEAALVRDILYVFQGIDGKYIKMNLTDNCYKMDAKVPRAGGERERAGKKLTAEMKDLFDIVSAVQLWKTKTHNHDYFGLNHDNSNDYSFNIIFV